MTENLTKLPVKSILRKSSLTFIEHDDADFQLTLDIEKPTKVIVEPVKTPPKEYPGETEDEKARRDEFEMKRKMNRHQEAMKVAIAKKLLSQEENIEEELDLTTEDESSEDNLDDEDAEEQESTTTPSQQDLRRYYYGEGEEEDAKTTGGEV